jgi:hypothetical protein
MRLSFALFALSVAALPALANTHAPYAGQQARHVKALSNPEIDDLRAGRGMGLAKAAELNSYPGPAHVLELREQLQLSPQQVQRTEELRAAMTRDAAALGDRILEREAALDSLFRDGKATEAAVQAASVEIGALQGRLRAVHLNTHIAMKALLKPEQVAANDRLRGYAEASDAKPAGHGGHKH